MYGWFHVSFIYRKGYGYHKGYHWSSTEVASTFYDLPLEAGSETSLVRKEKTCWPLHMGEAGAQRFFRFSTTSHFPCHIPQRQTCARRWRGAHPGSPTRGGRLRPGRQGADGQNVVIFQMILVGDLRQLFALSGEQSVLGRWDITFPEQIHCWNHHIFTIV